MRTLKKIGYVVYFNILFLSFVYVDLINETEWLKDTLYGITWIALLFAVIYYKKHNFDKILLLVIELIILNRRYIVEYLCNINFFKMNSTELTAWIVAAILFVIIIAIVFNCAHSKLKEIEAKFSDEADVSDAEPVLRVENRELDIDKGVWIVAIFLFLVSCYLLYLYQYVYMDAELNLSKHEDAISGVINFLSEYAILIVGVLIVIWLIVNAIESFLLSRKTKKDGNMESIDWTKRIFLLGLYLLLLIGFLENKNILSVDKVISVLTNNAAGIISVVIIFLYVGAVMVISLVFSIFFAFRKKIQTSFNELAIDILKKCKTTLYNIVNFIAFVTVDLFSAVVGLLVGDIEAITAEEDEDNDIGSNTEDKKENKDAEKAVSETEVSDKES